VTGFQVSGLFNVAGNVAGMQAGGLFNLAGDVSGMQAGGLFNSAGDVTGMQAGGLFNLAGDVTGMQAGGVFNTSATMHGFQVAGIANVSATMHGLQVAGVFNRAQTLHGLQIGLVSVNDSIESGGSLSLVNIVERGAYREWELSVADYSNVALTYRMGTRTLYTIYTVGSSFLEDNSWNVGIGFGHRRAIGAKLDFRPEIVSYHYYPMDFRDVQSTFANHLKLGFVYQVSDGVGLSLAPSVFVSNIRRSSDASFRSISPIPTFFSHETSNSQTAMGVSMSLGVNF
jgi:hypothetical protein